MGEWGQLVVGIENETVRMGARSLAGKQKEHH